MKVFVSEFLCSGAWPEARIETSLVREGRAMLTALVEDIVKIPGYEVVTTWDARLGECPMRDCDVAVIRSNLEEATVYRELARQSEIVWVIAPETGQLLEQRRAALDGIDWLLSRDSRQFIGPSVSAIRLTADKLLLSESLSQQDIETPETQEFDPCSQAFGWSGRPVVIKPRDGAGSQHTYLIRSAIEQWNVSRELQPVAGELRFVRQPFIAGKALSVGVLIAEDGTIRDVLPVAEQHLSDDGRFKYVGGRVPADLLPESALAVRQLAEKVCRAVPGLAGYVGCDIVLPLDRPLEPVLIEINPRLTTSYLGYRQLTDDNIPARLLETNSPPLRWKSEPVTFTV